MKILSIKVFRSCLALAIYPNHWQTIITYLFFLNFLHFLRDGILQQDNLMIMYGHC